MPFTRATLGTPPDNDLAPVPVTVVLPITVKIEASYVLSLVSARPDPILPVPIKVLHSVLASSLFNQIPTWPAVRPNGLPVELLTIAVPVKVTAAGKLCSRQPNATSVLRIVFFILFSLFIFVVGFGFLLFVLGDVLENY